MGIRELNVRGNPAMDYTRRKAKGQLITTSRLRSPILPYGVLNFETVFVSRMSRNLW